MNQRLARVVGITALVVVAAALQLKAQVPVTPFSQEVAKAEHAMNALQAALLTELRAAMERGGPPAAISVCHEQAMAIAERVAREQGIALGRTSHRLRNPSNAPRDWAKATVGEAAGTKAAAHRLRTVDLGNRVGVLRPIGTVEMCLRCHGAAETVRRELGTALEAAYPNDEATGFAVGDLRGWMWAEVPKGK